MFISDKKVRYAFLSILSNIMLIVFKTIAGLLSGSVSIISEAIHSSMDLAASLVAFLSVRKSAKPADKEHPYGHGKVENISGLAEGLLIIAAAALIIKAAIQKISEPAEIEQATIAIVVMGTSALTNFIISRKLYKVSQKEDSMALEADALHLMTDVYTSLGVGIGILLIKMTGLIILDSIVALFVAMLIIKEAWHLCKNAFEYLLDVKLPDEEESRIEEVIREYNCQFIDYHKLKTRKSGIKKYIDFHITVDSGLTVKETHNIIGDIKRAMNERFGNTRVSIHVDPYESDEKQESKMPLQINI